MRPQERILRKLFKMLDAAEVRVLELLSEHGVLTASQMTRRDLSYGQTRFGMCFRRLLEWGLIDEVTLKECVEMDGRVARGRSAQINAYGQAYLEGHRRLKAILDEAKTKNGFSS